VQQVLDCPRRLVIPPALASETDLVDERLRDMGEWFTHTASVATRVRAANGE
jgi:hypothetical protein